MAVAPSWFQRTDMRAGGANIGPWDYGSPGYDLAPAVNNAGAIVRENALPLSLIRYVMETTFTDVATPSGAFGLMPRTQLSSLMTKIHNAIGAEPLIALYPYASTASGYCPANATYAQLLNWDQQIVGQAGTACQLYELCNELDAACNYDYSTVGAAAAALWINVIRPLKAWARTTLGHEIYVVGPGNMTNLVGFGTQYDIQKMHDFLQGLRNEYNTGAIDPANFHNADLIPSALSGHCYGYEYLINLQNQGLGPGEILDAIPLYGQVVDGWRSALQTIWGDVVGAAGLPCMFTEWNMAGAGGEQYFIYPKTHTYHVKFLQMIASKTVLAASHWTTASYSPPYVEDYLDTDGTPHMEYFGVRSMATIGNSIDDALLTSVQSVPGASCVVTIPTGVVAGQTIAFLCSSGPATDNYPALTGFTKYGGAGGQFGTPCIYLKRAVGTEGGTTVTVTLTAGAGLTIMCKVFDGVDTTLVAGSAAVSTYAAATSYVLPTLTPGEENCWYLCALGLGTVGQGLTSTGLIWQDPSSPEGNGATGAAQAELGVFFAPLSVIQAAGGQTVTNSGITAPGAAIAIALKPAVVSRPATLLAEPMAGTQNGDLLVSVSNTVPTGVAAGDLILVCTASNPSTDQYLATAGYTKLASAPGHQGTPAVFWKVAVGTEGGTTVTVQLNAGFVGLCENIVVIRGGDASLVSGSVVTQSYAAATSYTLPSVTPADPHCWYFCVLGLNTTGQNLTPTAPLLQDRTSPMGNGGGTSATWCELGIFMLPLGGAIASGTFTVAQGGAAAEGGAIAFAIKPRSAVSALARDVASTAATTVHTLRDVTDDAALTVKLARDVASSAAIGSVLARDVTSDASATLGAHAMSADLPSTASVSIATPVTPTGAYQATVAITPPQAAVSIAGAVG